MSFDVGDALTDSIDRLTTSAGALVVVGLTIVGVVQSVARQDLAREFLEWLLVQLDDPEFREQLTAEEASELEQVKGEINAVLGDLPLALGLSPGQAALLWLLAFVAALVLTVVAIETFASGRDSLAFTEVERLGWKTGHLLLGWIAFGVLFVLGLTVFVIPGLLVALFLVFFAAAVVLDGESFPSAFASSFRLVRDNVGPTLGIVALCFGAFIGLGLVSSAFEIALPGAWAVIVGDLFSAVGQTFAIALITRAYVDATKSHDDSSLTEDVTG